METSFRRELENQPTEKSHHVVFLYELVPPLVVENLFDILLVAS